jgi:alpha-amylase
MDSRHTVGVDGFRVDAIKHIDGDFFNDWIDHLEAYNRHETCSAWENTGPTTLVR